MKARDAIFPLKTIFDLFAKCYKKFSTIDSGDGWLSIKILSGRRVKKSREAGIDLEKMEVGKIDQFNTVHDIRCVLDGQR